MSDEAQSVGRDTGSDRRVVAGGREGDGRGARGGEMQAIPLRVDKQGGPTA